MRVVAAQMRFGTWFRADLRGISTAQMRFGTWPYMDSPRKKPFCTTFYGTELHGGMLSYMLIAFRH